MNLMEISQVSYKEKRRLVNDICFMYKKIKQTKAYFSLNGWEVNDVVKSKNLSDAKHISFFEVVLEMLPTTNQEIIQKDFLNPDKYVRNWYEAKYSKTTYYKLKHEAINKFLLIFFA